MAYWICRGCAGVLCPTVLAGLSFRFESEMILALIMLVILINF